MRIMRSISADHPRVRGEQSRSASTWRVSGGSPPRARGAVSGIRDSGSASGITPACAGSSPRRRGRRSRTPDHPRVRGEQRRLHVRGELRQGSPPRARGAGAAQPRHGVAAGITPACAGSSPTSRKFWRTRRDHPRVRGEQQAAVDLHGRPGSPPRARGAGRPAARRQGQSRITPACAGSRIHAERRPSSVRDHPRVRGEQLVLAKDAEGNDGSPPRARGAGLGPPRRWRGGGITPACAGSSGSATPATRTPWDHPRVRGEQGERTAQSAAPAGSPPRARGAGGERPRAGSRRRITPACAGSRPTGSGKTTTGRDHPRVRGEQHGCEIGRSGVTGSPPRARGADYLTWGARDRLRGFHSLWLARSFPLPSV